MCRHLNYKDLNEASMEEQSLYWTFPVEYREGLYLLSKNEIFPAVYWNFYPYNKDGIGKNQILSFP